MEPSNTTMTLESQEPANATYQYQHIQSKSEIRILELYPPDLQDPSGTLRGNLITAKLADKPLYEAISYVWGPPIFSETLHLLTGTLSITPNLAAALRRFRYPDRTRRLWADAVCIDQQNGGDEKRHQVQLMGEVFRNTEHMLAWLGEGDEDTDFAIAWLKNLGNDSWKFGILSDPPPDNLLRRRAGGGVRMALEDLQSQILVNRAFFEKFFRQDWFQRLWIVQEVALAPRFTIHNGLSALNHETFSMAIASLYFMRSLSNNLVDYIYIEPIRLIAVRWSQQRDTLKSSLFGLITITLTKRYSNELDFIYALLGLSRQDDDISLEVNYDTNRSDLLTSIISEYLSRGDLWVMHYAGINARKLRIGEHNHISSLPSWVCNFEREEQWLLRNQNTSGSKRRVSTILKSQILPLIGIRGSLIGTANLVFRTPDTLFERQKNNSDYFHILEFYLGLREHWHQSIEESPETSHYLQEGEESAFARTLMADGMIAGSHPGFYRAGPSALLWHWRNFQNIASRTYNVNEGTNQITPDEQKEVEEYLLALYNIFDGHAFFVSRSGYIGIGPGNMRADDAIVIFDGNCGMPFVLRRVEGDAADEPGLEIDDHLADIEYADIKEKWELVGVCYLHGFMHGEEERPEFEERRQMFFIQ